MNTLLLHIWKDDSIRNIQDKFSDFFPGLQIRIFKHIEDRKGIHCEDIMFSAEVKMVEINPGFRDGVLPVSGNLTISELEHAFYNVFGLFVQIFRKNDTPAEESCKMVNFLLEKRGYQETEGFPIYRESSYIRHIPVGR